MPLLGARTPAGYKAVTLPVYHRRSSLDEQEEMDATVEEIEQSIKEARELSEACRCVPLGPMLLATHCR